MGYNITLVAEKMTYIIVDHCPTPYVLVMSLVLLKVWSD